MNKIFLYILIGLQLLFTYSLLNNLISLYEANQLFNSTSDLIQGFGLLILSLTILFGLIFKKKWVNYCFIGLAFALLLPLFARIAGVIFLAPDPDKMKGFFSASLINFALYLLLTAFGLFTIKKNWSLFK